MKDWRKANLPGGQMVRVARWDGTREHAELLGGLDYEDPADDPDLQEEGSGTDALPVIRPDPNSEVGAGTLLIRFGDGETHPCPAPLFVRLFDIELD